MKPPQGFARILLHFEKPLIASLSAFIVYFALSMLRESPFGVTPTAYFNYLADSFLHGQLHLRLLPSSLHDLSFFDGRYYLYWPPMPAVVLMPFVAIFGVNFSDIFFHNRACFRQCGNCGIAPPSCNEGEADSER